MNKEDLVDEIADIISENQEYYGDGIITDVRAAAKDIVEFVIFVNNKDSTIENLGG